MLPTRLSALSGHDLAKELNDGYDWGRLNLQSVTEQSSMDDFWPRAELSRHRVCCRAGLLTTEEKVRLKKVHEENKELLRIPRRGTRTPVPEALQQAERDTFLEWRRELAQLEEEQKFILTPFERNLDFWRQLWRVIERSDVVVQIVDGRNPLLFRCPDLRRAWARHFQKEGLRAVFWSALAEADRLDAEEKTCSEGEDEYEEAGGGTTTPPNNNNNSFHNSSRLLHKEELLAIFRLVGYPNVGKSSTINTIFRDKKVSVSATPGHTKHFQTLYVQPGLCLCDCPGLVMPSFVSTKAEMICCGILTYGINIIRPREDEDPDRCPTSEEMLMAYG
ncbi:hypothetical protein CRUP_035640, partial [Coryphaenoides rupestris]